MTEQATVPTPLPVGRPPHGTSEGRRTKILEMKSEGLPGVEIARRLGITPASVSYHLKKSREAGWSPAQPAAETEQTVAPNGE